MLYCLHGPWLNYIFFNFLNFIYWGRILVHLDERTSWFYFINFSFYLFINETDQKRAGRTGLHSGTCANGDWTKGLVIEKPALYPLCHLPERYLFDLT